MRRTWTAFLAGTAISLASAQATAEDELIQVLSVMSDDAFDEAQALTVALKRAASRAGWELDTGEYSLEVMVASFNCPETPDTTCMKKIAKKISSDHFVWGTMKKKGGKLSAHLRLWREGKNEREAKITYAVNLTDPNDDALMKVAEQTIKKLSGAAPGTVVLAAGTIDGRVFVDGEPAGEIVEGNAELQLPAGAHEIRVTAPGYKDAVGTITVHPGLSVELPLNPTKVGSVGPSHGGEDATKDKGEPMNMRRVAGYAAIGVGGALVVGGVFTTLKTNSINNDDGLRKYRQGFGEDVDACNQAEKGVESDVPGALSAAEAADKCNSAPSLALQVVLYGLGAAAIGGGTYLLVTDPVKEKVAGRVYVRPTFGHGHGFVDVEVPF